MSIILDYTGPVLVLIAAVFSTIGETRDKSKNSFMKLTGIGYTMIVIAVLGFALSIYRANQSSLETINALLHQEKLETSLEQANTKISDMSGELSNSSTMLRGANLQIANLQSDLNSARDTIRVLERIAMRTEIQEQNIGFSGRNPIRFQVYSGSVIIALPFGCPARIDVNGRQVIAHPERETRVPVVGPSGQRYAATVRAVTDNIPFITSPNCGGKVRVMGTSELSRE